MVTRGNHDGDLGESCKDKIIRVCSEPFLKADLSLIEIALRANTVGCSFVHDRMGILATNNLDNILSAF